jgi:hypothetical protein
MADNEQTTIDLRDVLNLDETVLRSTGAEDYGITSTGFVPKPFARLLAEKLALARALFGDELDLTSGSAVRKLLELTALEDARTWASMADIYDNSYIPTATGDGLSRLGTEYGIPRPFLEARGTVTLKLNGAIPQGFSPIVLMRGARMFTPGGHHAVLDETVTLTAAQPEQNVFVSAFYPGESHNLNPQNDPQQKLTSWNYSHPALDQLLKARRKAGEAGQVFDVLIEHTGPLTGGDRRWSDARYRALLLNAPRALWNADAIRIALTLVPGVKQVMIRDGWGGLDIYQSIFGNFNFIERVFSAERDLGSPYYFEVIVAPTEGAIWEGETGLRVSIENAIEDLRPISIFPRIVRAERVYLGIAAQLVVRGIPLPGNTRAAMNASPLAAALKKRLLQRIQAYLDTIQFGEPVRLAEITWAIMSEPGIVDVIGLNLVRYPGQLESFVGAALNPNQPGVQRISNENLTLQGSQIPVLVEYIDGLSII